MPTDRITFQRLTLTVVAGTRFFTALIVFTADLAAFVDVLLAQRTINLCRLTANRTQPVRLALFSRSLAACFRCRLMLCTSRTGLNLHSAVKADASISASGSLGGGFIGSNGMGAVRILVLRDRDLWVCRQSYGYSPRKVSSD